MESVRNRGRIGYLDGIRALAILSVLAVHWVSPYLKVGSGGYLGVDVFFVLSGYIITSILWRSSNSGVGSSWLRFIWRRAMRLYPALLVFAAVVPIVYAIIPHAPQAPNQVVFAAFIALIQGSSVYGAQSNGLGPFGHTWSLSVEWYFYLIWSLFIFVARRRGAKLRVLFIWCAWSSVLIYILSLLQSPEWFYYGPVARFPELIVGGMLALQRMERRETKSKLSSFGSGWGSYFGYASLAAFLVYVAIGPDPLSPVFRFVGLPLGLFTAVILIRFGSDSQARFLRVFEYGPITLLGRVSYSLYLWHVVPIALMKSLLPGQSQFVMAVVGVALAGCATAISYLGIERPMMRPQGIVLSREPVASTHVDV